MSDYKSTSIESIMTPLSLETGSPSSTILDMANKMTEKSKTAIIIVEDTESTTSGSTTASGSMLSRPVGIITEREI